MSGHTGDTGDPLRGDEESVTGATDSPVPQAQDSALVTAPGQAQPGPTGEPALAGPAASTAVPPLTAAPYVPQPPEVAGAEPPEVVQSPEAAGVPGTTWDPQVAWASYAPGAPEAPEAPGAPYAPGAPEAGVIPQAQAPPGAPPPPANPWAPPPGTVPDQPRKGRWRRITVMVLLLVIGLGATGAGGALLYLEETRHATAAEANAAGQQELASLWQRMTIGQIFPKTASYGTTGGISAKATLIGIAPQSSCAAAADPAVARALTRSGCVAMLRATYADQSGTILATVGIAVMKSTSGAQHILNAIAIQGQSAGEKKGILAVGFPGTAFPGSAREVFGSEVAQGGPYLFFYTAGYADGRSTSMQQGNGESITTDLGSGVMNSLSLAFTAPAKPCASKDISC